MAYEFKLPDLGEGLTEGEIARWLVTEGQELAEDDPLVEIQTDKTTVEIPSPAAGTVTRILVAEGEVVPVGTVLVVIGGDGAEPAGRRAGRSAAPAAAPSEGKCLSAQARVQATPLVRRIAAGAGRRSGSVERYRAERPHHRGRRPQRGGTGIVSEQHKPSEGRREPVRGVRRQIVEHLTRAHREVPAVTFVEECDFTGVDLKQLLPLPLKAAAASLQEFPELNARARGRRDRLPRPLRPRRRRPDRPGARRPGRPRLRLSLAGGARGRGDAARRGRARRDAEAGGAARRHVHRHERRQARRPARDAARQPPRGRRSSASTGSARAPSSATGRSSSARSATSRSRSTIASSTGRGRRRSRST